MDRFLIQYLKSLAVIIVFFTAMIGTYFLIHHERIFPSLSTLVVYGRNSCGITQSMRSFLEQHHVPYIYANIDNPLLNKEMWFRLHQVAASDPDPGYAYFPVIRINGETLERPDEETVLSLYQQANTKNGNDESQ